MILLSVERLSVGFGRYDGLLGQSTQKVLRDVSFQLDRGEILALVGASGAGKSVVTQALFDILPPNGFASGRIVVDGAPASDRARGFMGLVPQSITHLDPLARCGRQLVWAARRGGVRADRPHVKDVLGRFGLGPDIARKFPHQLSGGMARRLLLAMATITGPKLVIADEPTSGLDPANARIVLDHLRALADEGCGVLLITHDLTEAVSRTDRVALLADGALVGLEAAHDFVGDGARLRSDYARRLWLAMPQNDFIERNAHA